MDARIPRTTAWLDAAAARSDRLVVMSREALDAGAVEVAYHCLAAAMHAADDAKDAGRLRAIADVAREQIRFVDQTMPAHRVATASAAEHHHPGLYAMLVRQAEAYAAMDRRSAPHPHATPAADPPGPPQR